MTRIKVIVSTLMTSSSAPRRFQVEQKSQRIIMRPQYPGQVCLNSRLSQPQFPSPKRQGLKLSRRKIKRRQRRNCHRRSKTFLTDNNSTNVHFAMLSTQSQLLQVDINQRLIPVRVVITVEKLKFAKGVPQNASFTREQRSGSLITFTFLQRTIANQSRM